MTINETELKRVYQDSIASREFGNREVCPSPNELFSFFEPRARRKKKLGIVDHISHCPGCLREFGFLAELKRHEAELFADVSSSFAPEPSHQSSTQNKAPRLVWVSGAFAGIILALASLVVILTDRGSIDGIRGIGSAIAVVRPMGVQPVVELLVFEWLPACRVDSYVVEIFDDSQLRIWSSPHTALNWVQVPRAGPPLIMLDRTHYWMVTGYSGDVKIRESALIEFRLTGSQKRN